MISHDLSGVLSDQVKKARQQRQQKQVEQGFHYASLVSTHKNPFIDDDLTKNLLVVLWNKFMKILDAKILTQQKKKILDTAYNEKSFATLLLLKARIKWDNTNIPIGLANVFTYWEKVKNLLENIKKNKNKNKKELEFINMFIPLWNKFFLYYNKVLDKMTPDDAQYIRNKIKTIEDINHLVISLSQPPKKKVGVV